MEALAAGNPAPDIELMTVAGQRIKVSDFAGKYLLIYKFGLCPCSLQIHSSVVKLYGEHKDRLEIVGVTDSFETLKTFRSSLSAGTTFMGMDLQTILNGMLVYPWENDVELSVGDNSLFNETYFALGLPYFIFISPEGKILSREIGADTYRLVEKIFSGL